MGTARSFLVIGGGVSGIDAAIMLAQQGNQVLLSDKNPLSELERSQLNKHQNIRVICGAQTSELLVGIDAIILSPGVPYDIPIITSAVAKGVPIHSEIEFALSHLNPKKTIGITGTNGKSTVCMMCEHILKHFKKDACSAGNIGTTLSSLAASNKDHDFLVLELSSYQIEHSTKLPLDVALFTTFSFDHIARHKTMENYFQTKWKILQFLRPAATFIATLEILEYAFKLNLQIPDHCQLVCIITPKETPPTINKDLFPKNTSFLYMQHDFSILDDMHRIVGDLSNTGQSAVHNRVNALFSAIAIKSILPGADINAFFDSLLCYSHLPFRCQPVGKYKGYEIINDSKSTNVESTISALENFTEPVILLMGGRPKGEAYHQVSSYAARIKKVLVFGEAGQKIYDDLNAHLKMTKYDTLSACLADLHHVFEEDPGPIVFSPACASFDEFDNFEDRGRYFSSMIQQYFFPN